MASNLSAAGVGQLFQLLRDGVPRTRAELAKSSGLARSTVAARVDELMRMGLVAPVCGEAVARNRQSVTNRMSISNNVTATSSTSPSVTCTCLCKA